MLASFFFSLLAGFLTKRAEPLLEMLIEKVGKADLRLDALDFRVLSFGAMLLLAAIATALAGANSSAYLAVAGGLLGYFGADLYAYSRDPDGTMGDDGDDWDGDLTEGAARRNVAAHTPQTLVHDDDDQTMRAVQEAVQDAVRQPEPEPAPEIEAGQPTDPLYTKEPER